MDRSWSVHDWRAAFSDKTFASPGKGEDVAWQRVLPFGERGACLLYVAVKFVKCSFVLSFPRSSMHPAGAQAEKKAQAKHQLSWYLWSENSKQTNTLLIWLILELEMDISKLVRSLRQCDLKLTDDLSSNPGSAIYWQGDTWLLQVSLLSSAKWTQESCPAHITVNMKKFLF